MALTATIEETRPDALLTWRRHVVAPRLFEGYRRFEIEPAAPGHVRVTHVEDVHGLSRRCSAWRSVPACSRAATR